MDPIEKSVSYTQFLSDSNSIKDTLTSLFNKTVLTQPSSGQENFYSLRSPDIQSISHDGATYSATQIQEMVKADDPKIKDMIFEAAYNGKVEEIRFLLKNGVEPNKYLFNGLPLATLVKDARTYNWQEVRKVLKEFLTPLDKTYHFAKDVKEIKRIALVFHLKGTSTIADTVIDWEGGYRAAAAKIAVESIQKCAPTKEGRSLIAALEAAVESNTATLIQNYKNGEPVIILTGYRGHSTAFLLMGDILVHCNTGQGSCEPIEFYQCDPNQITEALLDRIISNTDDRTESDYTHMFTSLKNSVAATTNDRTQLLASICPVSFQKAGNCSWASIEGITKAFISISSKANNEKCDQTHVNERLDEITLYAKLQLLEKYLERHENAGVGKLDEVLVYHAVYDLKEIIVTDSHPHRKLLSDSLVQKLTTLYQKYEESPPPEIIAKKAQEVAQRRVRRGPPPSPPPRKDLPR